MKKTFITGLLLACGLLFVISSLAGAAPVGKITKLEGRVDVLKAGQRSVTPVSLGNNVDVGDVYRTKTDGRAEITFFNKNILRIAPATRVQVSAYSDDGTRSNQVMKLERGRVQAQSGEEFVKRVSSFAEGNKFEVHTPNAVAGIRGSGMTTGFVQMVTGLFFHTGRGYFYNPAAPGRIVNVLGGFMSFIVGMTGIPSTPVPGNVAYVGGSGFAPGTGGSGNGSTDGNLNNTANYQLTSLDQPYVFSQQPPITPSVFVGSVPSLSGTYSDMYEVINLSLNNVKFYGPSMTGVPQSWQADNVTGNYTSSVTGPSSNFKGMSLSGGGLTANLVITSDIDTSQTSGSWTANIVNGNAPSGVGTCTQPFTFSGNAAGTWNGTIVGSTEYGVINGIASGMATPVQVQSIYVGSIPYLEGSNAYFFVYLNDVKFYGPSTTSLPQTWVAGAVTGQSYTSTPTPGSFALTGPNASGNFNVTAVTATTLTATVTGSASSISGGSYTGKPVSFNGSATGTFPSAGGPIAGHASGTASP
ncbi:MAG TPA: FecR family protein [Syntrophorhabdaceae bacterium]|nr:FecR family protein [Syntrophorhabdaceae bacterium]